MVQGSNRRHRDRKKTLTQGKRKSDGWKEIKRGQRGKINGTWRKRVWGERKRDG